MSVKTYVPSNLNLLICGYKVEGWTKITVTRNSPTFKQVRGIRGKNTRIRLLDTSAVITLTVPQTEEVNDVLSAISEADSRYGSGRLEIMMSDLSSDTQFSSPTGYITMLPAISYESNLSDNVWEITCDRSRFSPGGAKNAAVGIVEGGISKLKDFVEDGLSEIEGIL